ncbi:hypothetical protein SHM7688_00282 [Shimia marina]|uniref:Uncharacterized protein n=1 Tax=Shimia marina TaxID=321267 RepID=A0A0P1EJZ3_9RHOB|nr:hypothetical protein SHM7688_00282 [Shimia marina]
MTKKMLGALEYAGFVAAGMAMIAAVTILTHS